MQVHRTIEQLPEFNKAVITIGTFDGVHAGHRKIIGALREEAARIGGESVLISFDPHPRKIVAPDRNLQLINTLEEKLYLLSQTGIDHTVVVPFTEAFSGLTAEQYISDFLYRKFRPRSVIIGYDHHFGKGRTGNFALLEAEAPRYGYRLIEIPPHVLNEIAVSSTKIRNALLESRVKTANALLGYPFFFEGRVVQGDQLGRTLGYPTANLDYTDADKIRLGHGVYAVEAVVAGQKRAAMLSIGNRPTLSGSGEKVEVHLLDFDRVIYGEILQVTVHRFLRAQERYASLDELVAQIRKDEAETRNFFRTDGF